MQLGDYVLEYLGHQLSVSEPEPGSACEHHGGHFSFGVPAPGAPIAEEMVGHTARVLEHHDRPVALFHVEHFDPELFLLSGDFQPLPQINMDHPHGAGAFLERLARRTGLWEPGSRTPRPVRWI